MRQIVLGLLLLVAFGVFTFSVSRFLRVMLKGRAVRTKFNEINQRLVDVLRYFFAQMSVARERASWHHLLIFWGFLIITVGTLEIILNGLIPSFSYKVISPALDDAFKWLLDLTNALVLAVMMWAFFRRLVLKPRLISMSRDAALILSMISLLCLTHFLMNAFAFVETGDINYHMPISSALYSAFRMTPTPVAAFLSNLSWWIHVLIVLFFLNYLPYSKHIHLLGSLPNIALRNRGQAGILPKLDLEDEKEWGVGYYERFDWKSLLDTYACTECARCSNNCPANTTDKPLSPMQLIHDVRDEMRERGAKLVALTPGVDPLASDEEKAKTPAPTPRDQQLLKELGEMPALVGGRIKDDVLWSCTTCGACEAVCPVFIEHPKKIIQMRTHAVLADSRIPAELARMFRGMENNQNPWGLGADKRMDWAEGLDVPTMADKGSAEYLVWIGCAGSFDDRAKKISRTWVQLLQKAGVDFAVLGLEEGCTGDAARRAGNEFLFQTLAEMNMELFKQYKVKKILVTCPHCYHSFKHEYPQFGLEAEVWHHTQFISKLIEEKKLQPATKIEDTLTYHDSCYLGRWNNIYEQPRDLLRGLCAHEQQIKEPDHTGYKSMCCGAGGGRMWMEEPMPRVNVKRTEQVLATGAKTIATACPFCTVMITDGTKSLNKEEEVQVLDVAELVWRSIENSPEKKNDSHRKETAN